MLQLHIIRNYNSDPLLLGWCRASQVGPGHRGEVFIVYGHTLPLRSCCTQAVPSSGHSRIFMYANVWNALRLTDVLRLDGASFGRHLEPAGTCAVRCSLHEGDVAMLHAFDARSASHAGAEESLARKRWPPLSSPLCAGVASLSRGRSD